MGSLIGWLVLKGIPPKSARLFAFAGLALVLLAAMGTMVCAYNEHIIGNHDAKREATIAKDDRKADTKAAEQRRVDDERAVTEHQEIKEAVNDAVSEGRDPRAEYYRCLGLQQAARRSNLPPASCRS